MLADGDVVSTLAQDLIVSDHGLEPAAFIHFMMAALLAASLWIPLATYLGAPVSTTHAIVGGVMGSGAAAAGFDAVNWSVMGKISASWVISPLAGGLFAALLLGLIKWLIIYRKDRVAAARRWVPPLVALMTGVFAMYLVSKGLRREWSPSTSMVLGFGLVFFVLGFALTYPWISRRAISLPNTRKATIQILN